MATGFEGFNDTASGGALPPKRQLVQGMTVIEGMPDIRKGYFVDTTEKREIGKTMEVVVLKVDTARTLFWEKGKAPAGVKGPRCFSDDGILPSARVKQPVSEVCAECQFASKDLVYRLYCYDVQESKENGGPVIFYIEAKSTQLKVVRAFVQAIRSKNRAARDFKVTMASQEQKNDKGSWYVIQFNEMEPVPSNIKDDVDLAYSQMNGPDEAIDSDDEVAF
jgi:hypothetical protein